MTIESRMRLIWHEQDARISITPVKELTVYGSLTSKVHFPDELDVKDIVSTVYHLVDNRYDLLPSCPEHLVGNITSVTFQLDHSSNYPILQKLLRQLELSMGETILLPSVSTTAAFTSLVVST